MNSPRELASGIKASYSTVVQLDWNEKSKEDGQTAFFKQLNDIQELTCKRLTSLHQ